LINGNRALILLGRTFNDGSSSRHSRIRILAAGDTRRNRAVPSVQGRGVGDVRPRNAWCARWWGVFWWRSTASV